MRGFTAFILLFAIFLTASCGGESVPSSPVETFKTYAKAIRKKDITTMKLLLSSETLKMHEQEAKAMGITVDDIVKQESLVTENQTAVEYRDEKIEGERATLEVKDAYRNWHTVHFVFENGQWKIDKKSAADQLLQQIEEDNRQTDEEMNINRPIPFDTESPLPTPPSNGG